MLTKKNISNSIICGIVAGAIVTSTYLVSEAINYTRKFNLLSKVDAAVDVNGDYKAVTSEWGIVYSTLGVENTGRRGEDLEASQLEKFLEIKEISD
jgi:hypothetical protein